MCVNQYSSLQQVVKLVKFLEKLFHQLQLSSLLLTKLPLVMSSWNALHIISNFTETSMSTYYFQRVKEHTTTTSLFLMFMLLFIVENTALTFIALSLSRVFTAGFQHIFVAGELLFSDQLIAFFTPIYGACFVNWIENFNRWLFYTHLCILDTVLASFLLMCFSKPLCMKIQCMEMA